MRNGFSMITAIFVIVIMATVAAFVMNLSGKIVKSTTVQYQREQANLYAKSYTEYAVMAVTAHDRSANCVESINGTIGLPTDGNGYRIRTRVAYIGPTSVIGNCAGTRQLSNNVNTASTPLTIIIDAYVDYKDPDNTSQWLTVHRRTVQKI
ncbi:MAG: type II secretion system protein [Sulfurovum sp.]|nr:type II secretion system protein [Sulfurovum sp.]